MDPLEKYLAVSEANRAWIYSFAGVLVAIIACVDWKVVEFSLGFLYIVPILMASATLRGWQIVAFSTGCGILREWFSPIHTSPGAAARISIGATGFALAGYFVSELNLKRQLVTRHLQERERQMQLRLDAEQQLRVVIETSPLAILTLDSAGRVLLANESAHHLFRLESQLLAGKEIQTHLPILKRFLNVQHSAAHLRTTVESRGQRADGEAFLAHVWLSTFSTNAGLCLAAFIWDASENLRDREGTGLDSMMATSRILIGAVSHEIRNLASAAASAHRELAASPVSQEGSFQSLGTIIAALEKIAASGLGLASHASKAVADLGMVLDEARVVIDASVREMNGTIHWKIASGLPLVGADHHSLLQVFLNLARNSEQAMKDTGERSLSVEASMDNDMVLVKFRDSGCGVRNPEALFQPFQPGASSTGLGLYISRAVLRSYGGDLRYEPNSNSTCFVVQLWPADERG